MSGLAWRNVDAPDFTSSMRGYETFSNLLERAFSGAQEGLGRYDASVDKQANNRLLMQFAGIQDPEAAKAALAALSSDPQARRFSAGTIDSVSGRPGALIAQALNQENLGWNTYQHARTKGFDTAEDAAAPLYADYLAASAAGKGGEWLKANPNFGAGLSMANRGAMFTSGQGARTSELGNETSEFGLSTGKTRFGWESTDRATGMAVDTYVSKFINSGHTDAADLDGDPAFRALPGNAQMMVRAKLMGVGGNGMPASGGNGGGMGGDPNMGGAAVPTSPGGGFGGSGYSGGGDPTRLFNYEARGKGYGSVPNNITTLGQFSDYAEGLNKKGVASTAAGLYQITGQTYREFAPSVLGKDWRNKAFDAQNQDAIGRAIFDQAKGSQNPVAKLMGRWAFIKTPAQAQAILALPWEKARAVISNAEASVPDPAALLVGGVLNKTGSAQNYMQQNAGNPLAAAIGDGSVLRDTQPLAPVSGWLAKKYGMPTDRAATMIQNVQAQARAQNINLNPRAAAMILEQSLSPNKYFFKEGNFLGTPDNVVSKDWVYDPKLVSSNIASMKTGDYQRQIVSNKVSDVQRQSGLFLEQRYRAKGIELQTARARAARNPNFDPAIIRRLEGEYSQYGQEYQTFLTTVNSGLAQNGSLGSKAQGLTQPSPTARPPVRPARPLITDRSPGWFGRSAMPPNWQAAPPVGAWPFPVTKR